MTHKRQKLTDTAGVIIRSQKSITRNRKVGRQKNECQTCEKQLIHRSEYWFVTGWSMALI